MTSDGPSASDALQVAQRALAKVNGLEDDLAGLQTDYDDVVDRLVALELRLEERDENTAYADLSLDEKVGKVREHAFSKAADGTGKAALDYDDIMWEVFDGEPGANHCYKLMHLAAGEEDDDTAQKSIDNGSPGFAVRNPSKGNRHLAVDARKAKRGVAFFSGNKAPQEEGR